MPILFQISIEVNVNSVGKIAEQIGLAAMAQGWESYITCCRNGCRPSKSHTIKIGNWVDVFFAWHHDTPFRQTLSSFYSCDQKVNKTTIQ